MAEAEIAVEVEALSKKIFDGLTMRGFPNDSPSCVERARDNNNVELLRLLVHDWVIDEYLFDSVSRVHVFFETSGYLNAAQWVTKNRVLGYENVHFAVQKICRDDRGIDGGGVLKAAVMSEYADDVQGTERLVTVILERSPRDRDELLSMLTLLSDMESTSPPLISGVL